MQYFSGLKMLASISASLMLLLPAVIAQVPFDITGSITDMTLDTSSTSPVRGGTITVDGMKITIPTNLLATLPAITVAWAELFKGGARDLPGSVSWQAHVQGNTVPVGGNVAGLVYISQSFFQTLQGPITSISPNGHFTIGVSNIDCVLNDPYGRYGLPQPGNELWSVDPDNPSIHAINGFPVCIPRAANDPLCPDRNRPNTTPFTFPDPSTIAAGDTTTPDARLMAPLKRGDYVTVQGTEIDGTLWVNSLVANLGLFTSPGTKPAYVTCEEAIYGIVTTQAGEVAETRAVAFTTDVGGALLDWFAMDQNPCDGTITERTLRVPMLPNAAVAPLGRAVYRTPAKADLTPATRSVGFRLKTGTTVTKNNITAGQFIQPIFDYVFPELLIAGDPDLPLAFETIPYLAAGSGPYVPGKFGNSPPATDVIVGQLSPWPGGSAPVAAPINCATAIPAPPVSSTSTSLAPTSTPPPVDKITIVSATGRNQKGQTTLTVIVTTTSTDPAIVLSLSASGQNPLPKTTMTRDSPGNWSLVVSLKSKPLTVTVTSSFGGSATGPVA